MQQKLVLDQLTHLPNTIGFTIPQGKHKAPPPLRLTSEKEGGLLQRGLAVGVTQTHHSHHHSEGLIWVFYVLMYPHPTCHWDAVI